MSHMGLVTEFHTHISVSFSQENVFFSIFILYRLSPVLLLARTAEGWYNMIIYCKSMNSLLLNTVGVKLCLSGGTGWSNTRIVSFQYLVHDALDYFVCLYL